MRLCLCLCLTPLLAACSSVGYYWQSVSGHVAMMQAARPVHDWLADPQTDDALKARLALAQSIRRYAVRELHLPDNASYQRYADLHRPAVVWNVSAAPAFSLKPVKWCFAVAGCVSYKGFFDKAQAEAEAAQLRSQGLEVSAYPVPAYSTLGRLNWAGGDPLLNTFIHEPDAELAGLIFHELAHQVVYAAGDTAFNESFATAVEKLGSQRWLQSEASAQARAQHTQTQPRRQQFRALVRDLRRDLLAVYGESEQDLDDDEASGKKTQATGSARTASVKEAGPPSGRGLEQSAELSSELSSAKAQAYERFHQRYAALKAQWDSKPPTEYAAPAKPYAGFDRWALRLNNAALSSSASYERWVPAFEALFKAEAQDWPRFYAQVRHLADFPKAERQRALQQLHPALNDGKSSH